MPKQEIIEIHSRYSKEAIQNAREYAASYEKNLIDSIESGSTKCNNPEQWVKELHQSIVDIIDGKCDNNFTVWQRMYYYLTGKSVPFLSK